MNRRKEHMVAGSSSQIEAQEEDVEETKQVSTQTGSLKGKEKEVRRDETNRKDEIPQVVSTSKRESKVVDPKEKSKGIDLELIMKIEDRFTKDERNKTK